MFVRLFLQCALKTVIKDSKTSIIFETSRSLLVIFFKKYQPNIKLNILCWRSLQENQLLETNGPYPQEHRSCMKMLNWKIQHWSTKHDMVLKFNCHFSTYNFSLHELAQHRYYRRR